MNRDYMTEYEILNRINPDDLNYYTVERPGTAAPLNIYSRKKQKMTKHQADLYVKEFGGEIVPYVSK